MMGEYVRAEGFAPVCDENSRVLVLGSFPSVRSRAVNFYYGHPQNRFWKTVCDFFGEEVPPTAEGRRTFCLRRGLALWDVITACEIVGSSDASIRNEEVANVRALISNSNITAILCNGNKSYSLFARHFAELLPMARKLSSTSPANPRYSKEEWTAALAAAFGGKNDYI